MKGRAKRPKDKVSITFAMRGAEFTQWRSGRPMMMQGKPFHMEQWQNDGTLKVLATWKRKRVAALPPIV